MFTPLYRKLFWKEFRMLWPLWVAVFVLGMLIDLGIFLAADELDELSSRAYGIFFVAAILPALYGLGSAGTQFAWELETGTFRRLRALPASSGTVVWGKLVWTITSTILLGVSLWGASYLWTGGLGIEKNTVLRLLNIYTLATAEAIVWGAIFSLRSRSPLMATIYASVLGLFIFCLEIWFYFLVGDTIKIKGYEGTWKTYEAAWPFRLLVLFVLIGLLVYLARSWFDYWRRKESKSEEGHPLDAVYNFNTNYIQGDGGFMALCQQHWRRNLMLWIPFCVVIFVAGIICLVCLFSASQPAEGALAGFTMFVLFFGCTLIGSNVFGADQGDRGFRFFAHHGATIRQIWFSRVLLSGIFFFALWAIGVTLAWQLENQNDPQFTKFIVEAGIVLGPVAFVCGAFFSVLCHSRVLAWVWSFGLTYVCCLLSAFLFFYQVSPFLILLPGFGLMLCSYLTLSDRIYDRNGLRVLSKTLSPLAICLVIFVGLVITQRIQSVPDTELKWQWLDDYALSWTLPESSPFWKKLAVGKEERPEQWRYYSAVRRDPLEEFRPFEKLQLQRVKMARPSEWLFVQNHSGYFSILSDSDLDKILEIVNQPGTLDWSQLIIWPGLTREDEKRELLGRLERLRYHLFLTAEYYSRQGEPKKSLDCLLATIRLSPPLYETNTATMVFDLLPRWSAGLGVTPESVEEAIRRIQALEPPGTNLRRMILAEYLNHSETLDNPALMKKNPDEIYATVFTILPWEHARTKRLARQSTVHALDLLDFWKEYNAEDLFPLASQIYEWNRQQDLQKQDILSDVNGFYTNSISMELQIANLWQTELFRRIALASLAIRAYQLKHGGKLPDTLDEVFLDETSRSLMSMPGGPPFGFQQEGLAQHLYIQPCFLVPSDEADNPIYQRTPIINDLSNTSHLILDTNTLYKAYGLFPKIGSETGRDKILELSDEKFYTISTVYPLLFVDKKQED